MREVKIGNSWLLIVNTGQMVSGAYNHLLGGRPEDIIVQNLSIREIGKDEQSFNDFIDWIKMCATSIRKPKKDQE